MSRRPEPPNLLSLWCETRGAHACARLRDAIADAVYDVVELKHKRRRRGKRRAHRQLVVLPNVEDARRHADALRFCPYCGARITPVRSRQVRGAPTVPDQLPEDVE